MLYHMVLVLAVMVQASEGPRNHHSWCHLKEKFEKGNEKQKSLKKKERERKDHVDYVS
jgi:hypothetical protein